MATENWQINHPVSTGAALDSGAHQGLFGYDTTTGRCRFQFGALAANAKSLANFGDAPTAHKTSHEYGGADALVGQNIAGLRTSDSPNFTSIVASSVTRISAAGAAALTGLTSSGGATITGAKTSLATGTTGYATLNLGGTGVAPTSPVDGDVWRVADGAFVRMGANSRELVLSGTTQTIAGAKTFSALATFSLGATVNGGKTTLAAGVVGYASLNIPTGGTPTTPVNGDEWKNGPNRYFQGSGLVSVIAASDTLGGGSYLTVQDSVTATKGWLLQLGASNTLDFWNYTPSTWTRRIQMSSAGGIGFFNQAAPTTRPTLNAACTDLPTAIALINQIRTNLIACGMMQ